MYKRNDPHDDRVPRHAKTLVAISAALGHEMPKGADIHIFFRRKVTKLYKQPAFQKFLDSETSFLPKGISGIQRWYHYINRDTVPHSCPICGKLIPDYKDKYCCHECSTKESTGAKRGPKIDLAQKEREHRTRLKADRPDYKVVKFGYPRSLHRHSCGREFEANNYSLYAGRNSCPCQHKKVVVQTLANLIRMCRKRKSVWVPVEYDKGETATYKNKKCGHMAVLPWARQFDLRCPVCYPNKLGTRVKTHDQYVRWLANARPDLSLLGEYVDSKTRVKYRHLSCGKSFLARPCRVTSRRFRCPRCAPPERASYTEVKVGSRTFQLRGKEVAAIHWIFENTRTTARDIYCDADGTPDIRYEVPRIGGYRRYVPDFHIPHLNLLIEAKDPTSLGLHGNFFYYSAKEMWEINCAKAQASIDSGFKFKMLVFDSNNDRIKLPRGWHHMTHKEIMRWYQDHNCKEEA